MASVDERLIKIKNNIQLKLNNQEYYEAHQLYKVLYFRSSPSTLLYNNNSFNNDLDIDLIVLKWKHLKLKNRQNYKPQSLRLSSQKRYKEALDLMMEGATALFDGNQMSSAVELALLFVDLLEKSNAFADTVYITHLSKLHSLIAPDHIEKPKFVTAALQWACKSNSSCSTVNNGNVASSSSTSSHNLKGSVLLHGEFGINYWREKDYVQARYHLVRSYEGEACASMLIEYHITCGYPYEVDLFIAQAVLQLLCMANKSMASICFNRYTSKHPQVEPGPPYIRPIFNFLWMLLIAIDKKSLAIFTVLCEQYDLSLRRDPSYHDYLARIAQLFFNVPMQKKTNSFGLFGNILPELLKSDEDKVEPCPVELD